jgi:hypothetical protein
MISYIETRKNRYGSYFGIAGNAPQRIPSAVTVAINRVST